MEAYGEVEQLEYLIGVIIPANILVESYNHIRCSVEGLLGMGGGACTVEEYTVSTDFKETYNISGDVIMGAGVVMAETITAVSDGI